MASRAQVKASVKYNKEKTILVSIRLNKETDKDIIEILNSVDSKQGFIKELIRAAYEEKDDTFSNIAPVLRRYELGSYYNNKTKKS